MFDKVDGFIRDYDEIKYLVLLGLEKYDGIFDRIIYLIGLKSGTRYVDSHMVFSYSKTKTDWDVDLSLEKTLNMCNFVIFIKSAFNKNRNQYYYKMFLEKCAYQLAKKDNDNKIFW